MSDRENLSMLLEMSKKDGGYLAAFETLGRAIEDLRAECRSKDFIISSLKEKLAEAEGRMQDGDTL